MKKNIPFLGLMLSLLLFASTAAAHSISEIALVGTEDPYTRQTIAWKTEVGESSLLACQPAAEQTQLQENWPTRTPQIRLLFTNPGAVQCNSVRLDGLRPDTDYVYRIGSRSKEGRTEWTELRHFRTASRTATEFSFLVFGDSQNNMPANPDYSIWHETITKAYASHPEARFFVSLGDLVQEGQNYPHWSAWFEAAQGVIDKIPAYPVLGNHETFRPRIYGSVEPIAFERQWPVPQNGPKDLNGTAYAFDYGSVHFAVLNTQDKEYQSFGQFGLFAKTARKKHRLDTTAEPSRMLTEQSRWLEKDLSESSRPWKIILQHKPMYPVSSHRSNPELQTAFAAGDKEASLILSGHEHAVAHSDSRPLYYIAGQSGGKVPRHVKQQPPYTFFTTNDGQPDYLFITVTASHMRIQCLTQDGQVLDDYTMNKDPALPAIHARAFRAIIGAGSDQNERG